ncbi:hypothetical protein H4R18_003901 [Coemansia javaensis]|uniref:peptidyl-tRNA hydrolase n=1 Tax=Coemansia javaensis TaxID=2761396 RepID=A0A9W8H7A2_9FUNG|nr:hypothetical protein H4R18_003901 [Coemansia javaensis]
MAHGIIGRLASLELPLWQVLLLGGAAFLIGRRAQTGSALEPEPEPKPEPKSEPDSLAPTTREHLRLARREGTKLVLVVRTDLAMGGAEVAAQCAQATLECYRQAQQAAPGVLGVWGHEGQAKVTVKCRGEDEIARLEVRAREAGLVAHLSASSSGSARTVLGVGPGPISVINSVTGSLKLY